MGTLTKKMFMQVCYEYVHIYKNRQTDVTKRNKIKQTNCQLTECLWTVGGSQRTHREPTQTRGEHANSAQKGPDQ